MKEELTDFDNPFFRLPMDFDPHTYYGSLNVVKFILDAISSAKPKSLELSGLPGMGKSTLLQYLAHPEGALSQHREWLQAPFRSNPQRLLMVHVDFRRLSKETNPFVYLYEQFREACAEKKLVLPQSRMPDQPEQAIDMLGRDITTLSKRDVRLVLLLDDFDLAFEKMTFNQTTDMRDWRDSVSFILVTERSLLGVNPAAAGSPFFIRLPVHWIHGLSRPEAIRLLEEPARKAERPFPPEDVEFILQFIGRHPYLLLLAGRALWDIRSQAGLLDRADQPLSRAYQDILWGRLKESTRSSFQLYWNRTGQQEQRVLKLLASQKSLTKLTNEHLNVLDQLVQKGLVTQDHPGGEYEPFSPLFTIFMEETEIVQENAGYNFTEIERKLYEYFRHHEDEVISFQKLGEDVWGEPATSERDFKRRIQVTISRLRQKLQKLNGEDIISVRDQGYRFVLTK